MKHIMSFGLAAVLFAASGVGSGGGTEVDKPGTPAPVGGKDKSDTAGPTPSQKPTQVNTPAPTLKEGEASGNKGAPGHEFESEILTALSKLKHNEDGDWQEDGKPSLKRIVALAGNDQITRKHVNAVAPDFEREKVLAEKEKTSKAAIEKDKDENAAKELVNARVRALERGQYGGRLYDAGDEFTYSGPQGKWFIKLKDKATAKDREAEFEE